MARATCLDCVRKHIAQASILMDESRLGYPFHRWYAAGHLAEAESESRFTYPELAKKIRAARLVIMQAEYDPGDEPIFDDLIIEACKLAHDSQDLIFDKHNSKSYEKKGGGKND